MRHAKVFVQDVYAGLLLENNERTQYIFEYQPDYQGPAVSLTMPIQTKRYEFNTFPPFFDGVLPEGIMLQALLKQGKLDRQDYLGQLITVGADLVGAVTVFECEEEQ